MQALTFTVKGNVGFGFQNRQILQGVCDFRSRNLAGKSLRMTERSSCFGVNMDSASMGIELGRARRTVQSVFGSSAKPRSHRVRASGERMGRLKVDNSWVRSCYGIALLAWWYGEDIEDAAPLKVQGQSSGSVLPYVGVACLGAILFGYHLGVVNGALEYLAKDLGIAENTVIQGNTVLAGAFVGSFTGGALADQFGRTKTFILDAIPLAVGAFLCTTAQSVQAMIIGRLLTGIGIGISSAIVPLYISEISPTEIRGTLGTVNQLFICIGILAALVAGLPLSGNPLWWRTMFGISLIPSVLLALGMAFSPESPRWLYQQGRISEAETSIKRLYGKERVAEVMGDLEDASQGSSEPDAGWLDLFSSRYWKVVSIGAAMFLFQQLAGINAVVYYSTAVFRSAGITSDVAASALVGSANVFGTMVASSLMDKQGRKSLLLISFSGMVSHF
ncbi:Plastidic glucose transporter 4 [Capsicum baccatum]|uniref:Plastidic glucose transporter 4 n=1 Tax=Capsicum baccatum TaxID=33114 RepID=A0A2G2XGU0_CAPBA|nr:Plastidic glucose transporter 4 [Capsicum baccatum]